MSIAEVRAVIAGAPPEPGDSLWSELAGDPRKGVRALHDGLLRRIEREAAAVERSKRLRRYEAALWERGVEHVAGVDEAGRGPLAGPVVAAAVVLPRELTFGGIDDSKKLTPRERERLYELIREEAVAVGVGQCSESVIDEINILRATHRAMRQALDGLGVVPGHILVDGDPVPDLPAEQTAIPRGDEESAAVAAASIIAKVTRDRLLVEYDRQYPGYGFARHKGYGTPDHIAALTRLGPCEIHRRSFSPVLSSGGGYSEAFTRFRTLMLQAEDVETLDDVASRVASVKETLAPYEISRLRGLYKRAYRRISVGMKRRP
jgi:ribonuclease HII